MNPYEAFVSREMERIFICSSIFSSQHKDIETISTTKGKRQIRFNFETKESCKM
jgi:hypothetical protein